MLTLLIILGLWIFQIPFGIFIDRIIVSIVSDETLHKLSFIRYDLVYGVLVPLHGYLLCFAYILYALDESGAFNRCFNWFSKLFK